MEIRRLLPTLSNPRWMVLVSLLGGCLLLGIPSFHRGPCGRPSANEHAAIATLRSIAVAQVRFQNEARRDRDADGVGEYGFLAELAEGDEAQPACLPRSFSETDSLPHGGTVVRRAGYLFQVFLPGAGGGAVSRSTAGPSPSDVDRAELEWCCYAWPADGPDHGRRVFFIDQDGAVYEAANEGPVYDGFARTPAYDAAFAEEPVPDGDPARRIERSGRDGQRWASVFE